MFPSFVVTPREGVWVFLFFHLKGRIAVVAFSVTFNLSFTLLCGNAGTNFPQKRRVGECITHKTWWKQEKQEETTHNLLDIFEWIDGKTMSKMSQEELLRTTKTGNCEGIFLSMNKVDKTINFTIYIWLNL